MNLGPIKYLIKERLGLQFAEHTEDALRRALAKRLAGTGAASVAAYMQRLDADEAEWHELTSLLTINETYFYREPQHLRLLTGALTTELLTRVAPGKRVRILSMGCSTGEEPYSIAMALREQYGESADRLFEIAAGDVDHQALDKARTGVYGAYSFRALPSELAGRYFTPVDAHHRQIDPALRRLVALRQVNVLAEAYPQDWAGQDVVFFRNVSIYFDAATRRAIHQRLQALLNPGGYLIVSATETLPNDFGLMNLEERDGVFFFVNRLAAQTRTKTPAFAEPLKSPTGSDGRRKDDRQFQPDPVKPTPPDLSTHEVGYQNALMLTREHRFDEALQALALLCVGDAAQSHHWALQAHVLLERGDAVGALAAVERALALDAWSVDALLLQGRIARFQGHLESAIGHFRQVVYSRPDCWPAHYHLAELYRDRGQTALAVREYRIVLRQIADRDGAMQTAGRLPLAMSIQDLRFLCETQLSRLGQTAD
ncbi:MAG: chemotaxis protein methyltransferase CheR [Pseudomonadota bacterium]|nr:chemotaxis protein methyltransferase CheR [Pseudomonadota bacterium]